MSRMHSFASASTLLATVLVAACNVDAPAGPSRLQPSVLAGVEDAKAGVKRPGRVDRETYGNNLSNPVIFAEARGLTGLALLNGSTRLFANTGMRPSATTDTAALAEISAGGNVPFWYSGNTAVESTQPWNVFWQQSSNTWQAEWVGRPTGKTPVVVDWGDNLRSVQFAVNSVIRVEHVLVADDGTMLQGYPMDVVMNPSSSTEKQGIFADGMQKQTVALTPTVFSDRVRLKIEKLADKGGAVTYTYFDKAVYEGFGVDGPDNYAAEINVGGRLVYGYVWMMKNVNMPNNIPKDGWWRITFSVDNQSGVAFTTLGVDDETIATVTPTATVAEIFIKTRRGGGGGGGGGGSGENGVQN